MKKIAVALLLFCFSTGAFTNPLVEADTLRINGHLALWLNTGNDWDQGFYYGFFVGDRVKSIFDNYVIPNAFGGAVGYSTARQKFEQHFLVDEKYNQIASGMIEGMKYAGVDLFSAALNDTLTYKDVLIANSIPDFTGFSENWHYNGPGCSNLTSWGQATANAPDLLGQTVINRNLDWVNNPYLINNALIVIWVTGNPAKQSLVTFGFAGMIGALSGINASGVATFQNMGNYTSYPTGTGFYPVNLAQRNGLESADYNADGICSPRDVTDAVRAHNVAGTFIIHSAGPSGLEIPAEILEIHNAFGYEIRTREDNPEFFGDNLVATNHFRKLKPPAYCYRYSRISDSLQTSNELDINRNWNVLKAAGVYTNLQTIQFVPNQNMIRFSFAAIGTPAYLIQPGEVWMDTLFTMFNVGIHDKVNDGKSSLKVYPNPGKDLINIEIATGKNMIITLTIRDLKGKEVYSQIKTESDEEINHFEWNTSGISNGVYFAAIETRGKKGKTSYREIQKIVVAR